MEQPSASHDEWFKEAKPGPMLTPEDSKALDNKKDDSPETAIAKRILRIRTEFEFVDDALKIRLIEPIYGTDVDAGLLAVVMDDKFWKSFKNDLLDVKDLRTAGIAYDKLREKLVLQRTGWKAATKRKN